MFENPRRDRQARNFTTNAPKILELKSSPEQIFSLKLPLGASGITVGYTNRFCGRPVMLYSAFPQTADMIIIALLISISLVFIYFLHTTVSCKPSRELAHILVAFDHLY